MGCPVIRTPGGSIRRKHHFVKVDGEWTCTQCGDTKAMYMKENQDGLSSKGV